MPHNYFDTVLYIQNPWLLCQTHFISTYFLYYSYHGEMFGVCVLLFCQGGVTILEQHRPSLTSIKNWRYSQQLWLQAP